MVAPAQPARIVFAGTPKFACPTLAALLAAGHTPVAVYTQPDRPAGRGRRLTPSPVKQLAQTHALPVLQPQSLRGPEAAATLAALQPDVLVVIAYGLLLPPEILAIPRCAAVNLHASLLPRWRGAAPIQRAILAGDTTTGVCLMRMERGLDTGAVYACDSLALTADMTAGAVHDQLAQQGAHLLLRHLDALVQGQLTPQPQPATGVTYAQKLHKSEAWLDWTASAEALDRQIRAFNPWPIAQTQLAEQVVRIHAATPEPETARPPAPPGTLAVDTHGNVLVMTGAGLLRLEKVQLPGRRAITAQEWARSTALSGQRFLPAPALSEPGA